MSSASDHMQGWGSKEGKDATRLVKSWVPTEAGLEAHRDSVYYDTYLQVV